MDRVSIHFLLVCLAIVIVIVYLVIQPFLGTLILAGVFAFLFQPMYQRVLRAMRGHEGIAAFLTTVFSIILVILPITFLGAQILKESGQLYSSLAGGTKAELLSTAEEGIATLRALFPIPQEFHVDIGHYVREALGGIVQNLGSFFSSVAKGAFMMFVFLVSLFFLLKDGGRLEEYVIKLSPLLDKDDEFIVRRLKLAVAAVVKGSLSVSILQGLLTGVGFAIFGMPNAVLWGSVAAVASLVPGIGTALVLLPAILYLFFSGHPIASIGLTIWGATAVGLVDNFLGPRIIGKGIQLHPLAAFLAVIGGLAFFGPLGFLLGPLSVSLCLALVEIYFSLRHQGKVKA